MGGFFDSDDNEDVSPLPKKQSETRRQELTPSAGAAVENAQPNGNVGGGVSDGMTTPIRNTTANQQNN